MQPVIILFAKAPIPGRVKTRLQPPLSPGEAASLHEGFVHDLILRLQSFTRASLELHTDIPTDAWARTGVAQRLQSEGDLPLKMFHALQQALLRGHERAMIVGTDAPTLPVEHLEQLLASESDVALGPTDDGGYYAIACRHTHPAMFDHVIWSGPQTLEHTVHAIERAGLSVALGPRWFDVDEPADLERLALSADLPPHTARWFAARKK
ncbi:MAG: TIGR04282 family arsenosugar biosynthesis glycosyltransferase [Bryobacteraceae bacterium]